MKNLKGELNTAKHLLDRCQELAWLSDKISGCDAALSDLLEHVDGYPSAPITDLQSPHVSDRSKPPEEQLTARVAFTDGLLKDLDALSASIAPDPRVVTERERLEQTWSELQEMCTDRLNNKSRPSTASGREPGSGRTSSLSRGSSSSARSVRTPPVWSRAEKTPSKKHRGNLGLGPSPRPSMVLSPVTPRNSSSRITSEALVPPKERKAPKLSKRRSTSGPQIDPNSSIHKSTFSSRQRNASIAASDLPVTPTKPSFSGARSPFKTPKPLRSGSPTPSDASSINTKPRSLSGYSAKGAKSPFSKTPRPPVSRQPVRKPYVANPKNKLDVAVGNVVNKMAVSVPIQAVSPSNWEDKSGKYWIGDDEDAKLCFCRILRSQTVMVVRQDGFRSGVYSSFHRELVGVGVNSPSSSGIILPTWWINSQKCPFLVPRNRSGSARQQSIRVLMTPIHWGHCRAWLFVRQ